MLAYAEVTGRKGIQGQGPFMYIHLACRGRSVEKASFETYGCPSAIRCGEWLTKWVVGRPVDSLPVIEPKDLQTVVGGLPLGKEFCAVLAVDALRDALQNFRTMCQNVAMM